MWSHTHLSPQALRQKIKEGSLTLGGNKKLKIYGRLHCGSGKRMKKQNRVFFKDETEAQNLGYRPCGHCMRQAYLKWVRHNFLSTKIRQIE